MTRSDAIEQVLAQAGNVVGIHEEPRGSNDGPALRRLLAGTEFAPGQAWCAYFVQAIGRGGEWVAVYSDRYEIGGVVYPYA